MPKSRPETPEEFMRRYPRVTAHIIAESLGYATPSRAARIGLDGLHGSQALHAVGRGPERDLAASGADPHARCVQPGLQEAWDAGFKHTGGRLSELEVVPGCD